MQRGENVRFSLSTADAHAGVALPLYDDNGLARTLAGNERFVLDSMIVNSGVSTVNLFVSSTSTTIPVLSFGSTASDFHTDYEGVSFLRSTAPWVVAPAGMVILTGTGYIQYDGGWISRPTYRENLTGGGNY